MEKIPCIECTLEIWEYVEPYLMKWGYITHVSFDCNFTNFPLLVINTGDNLGLVNNTNLYKAEDYSRELVTNVEEFLERAAKLKGFTYKRTDYTMKFNGIVLEPGMILVSSTGTMYIVFPAKGYLATVTYEEEVEAYNCWYPLEDTLATKDIVKVLDAPKSRITDGKVLWEKPKEVVITLEDIAEKFKCKVEQIRIKE